MICIIERVTCDQCGQIFEFEKLSNAPAKMTARLESISEWLRCLGWTSTIPDDAGSLRALNFCPFCSTGSKKS